MRLHYVQHVPFEGLGAIAEWAAFRGHSVTGTEVFGSPFGASASPGAQGPRQNDRFRSGQSRFPDLSTFDFLVIMGGPMGVYDDAEHPWLPAERAFINEAIGSGKNVLGICLGAQLIAAALGAPVKRAPHTEIGWYPVELTAAGRQLPVFADFPDRFEAFHWHGDMFELPQGAVGAARSAACPHQALVLEEGRVVGLQFHLEETPDSVSALVEHAGHELTRGQGSSGSVSALSPWIASREQVLSLAAPYRACRELLFALLDRMLLAR